LIGDKKVRCCSIKNREYKQNQYKTAIFSNIFQLQEAPNLFGRSKLWHPSDPAVDCIALTTQTVFPSPLPARSETCLTQAGFARHCRAKKKERTSEEALSFITPFFLPPAKDRKNVFLTSYRPCRPCRPYHLEACPYHHRHLSLQAYRQ